MNDKNMIKNFDEDLTQLDNIIAEMGGLAEAQLADAIDAMLKRDVEKAELVIEHDARIDVLETEVDASATALLALRQPVAEDLRIVICALKTAAILERIGDYAKNIAKRTIAMSQSTPIGPSHTVARMGTMVQSMIKNVLDAYAERDADKAEDVRQSDQEVDALHTSLFREVLTYMMEDPRFIGPGTHLLFIAKNIERIGDHTTSIAKNVYILVHGAAPEGKRPKDDTSSYTVIENIDLEDNAT
jgi:phosphate transport system protein